MIHKNEYHPHPSPISNEVYLRHLTVDEAILKLDKYLDDAFMAGLYQVRIIHGKGSGTLRHVVQEQLAKHSLVKSYRPGAYGEGGTGVTMAELAEK
jgi:DNA mismatch repair protein MutS2